ncbi:MAG: hypothetical protein LLG06_13920 [Desulfobacteraceae bacterium]|nr:hypothetical protein [Desulfobacteraceae bacterium]
MPPLDKFFHKKIALVNLASGTTAVEPWPRSLANEAERCIPGGSAAAAVLSGIYGDALVLATGPLTGTMSPGSSLLVASCPVSGGAYAHVPILLRHGTALKTTGVDFAVVSGKASSPSILILGSKGPRIEPAGGLSGLEVPGMRKFFRARLPETRHSLLLCGPASGWGSCGSAALENGTSLDRGHLAPWMSNHNLLAIVLTGGGSLPFAGGRRPLFDKLGPKSGIGGFLDVLEHVEGGAQAKGTAEKILGRPAACHSCPWPCMAYLKPGPSTNGLLCADHAGFAALCGACPDSLPSALEACLRLGIDPVSGASAFRGVQPDAFGKAIENLFAGVPPAKGPEFSFPLLSQKEAPERALAGMVLGICPILVQRCPDIPVGQWAAGPDSDPEAASFGDMLKASLQLAAKARTDAQQEDMEIRHG